MVLTMLSSLLRIATVVGIERDLVDREVDVRPLVEVAYLHSLCLRPDERGLGLLPADERIVVGRCRIDIATAAHVLIEAHAVLRELIAHRDGSGIVHRLRLAVGASYDGGIATVAVAVGATFGHNLLTTAVDDDLRQGLLSLSRRHDRGEDECVVAAQPQESRRIFIDSVRCCRERSTVVCSTRTWRSATRTSWHRWA